MMRATFTRLLIATVVVLSLTVGTAASVMGYVDQTRIAIQLSGPSGTVKCDRTATITAKVVSLKDGKPVRQPDHHLGSGAVPVQRVTA